MTRRDLEVGDRVTLELLDSGGRYVSLVQAVGEGLVRLAAPIRRGEIVRPRPRERLTVWLTAPDAVYGFHSVVLALDLGSQPALVAASPVRFRRVQRREDVREWMSIEPRQVLLESGERPVPISAIILNVSAAGVLLSTPVSLQPGSRLWLAFQLPDGADVEARAEVVRVEEAWAAEGSGHRVAARFIDISRRAAQAIVRAIYNAQARRRRKERGRSHSYDA